MTWDDKLTEIRDTLENMVTLLNKDKDYEGAQVVMEALQKVARINDHMEIPPSELDWK